MVRYVFFALAALVVPTSAFAQGPLTLEKKAALFQTDIERRFMIGEGQVACKMYVPTADRPDPTYNMPDNAYMTGIYAGTLSMKFAATKDSNDREAALKSVRALNLLCNVSGKKGLLARAAWPKDKYPHRDDGEWGESPDGKHLWRGDVSSDQMDGVFFGYSLAYDLVAGDEDKKEIARNVAALMDHVIENGFMIVDADGKPTQFGKYMPGYVKIVESMNALLLLQLLKVAVHVTGEKRFADEYRRMAVDEGYADVALNARHAFGRVNFSDDVLLFLAYFPLLRLEDESQLRDKYLESLRRVWEGTPRKPGAKAQGNPFYAFVSKEYLKDESGVQAGIDTLKWFPLDMKWNQSTIAAYEKEFGFTYDPKPVSPEPKPGEAIPVDRREKSWSAWVMDPFRDAGTRTADSALEYNGHDYLLGYWAGRYLGLIAPGM